jgi:hypothetical protein
MNGMWIVFRQSDGHCFYQCMQKPIVLLYHPSHKTAMLTALTSHNEGSIFFARKKPQLKIKNLFIVSKDPLKTSLVFWHTFVLKKRNDSCQNVIQDILNKHLPLP